MLTMKITAAVVLLIQVLRCLGSDDSPFQLVTKATGFCLVKHDNFCYNIRWTTGDRLLVYWKNKCLGVQGKSVGSEISLYDCDEKNELQQWECKNETLLALKGQELYVELSADNTAVLSRTIGPNNHLTISGTSSGACTRTYREVYTIEGTAAGSLCMFPFQYQGRWYSDCTMEHFTNLWCAVETNYENELWGTCPTNSREHWQKNIVTGAYYQLNIQAALTWSQAEESCKQQGAALLSITDPHEQAYITTLLAGRGQVGKLWIGLALNSEHGWQWANGKPYRYMYWDSGHPLTNPEHSCAVVDGAVRYTWQSSQCTKNLSYICYSEGAVAPPTAAMETGSCSRPWIPYSGHCFHLYRTQKTWSEAQKACRKEGGDLVSIRNVEDQGFVISQLGYAPTDELWIGLNDKKKEGLFEWSDHSTVSFTSWEFGNPAVSPGAEDCVLIKGEIGNWDDRACEEKHGFICMMTSASEPAEEEPEHNAGCKTGWKRHGSYCYFIGTQSKTFDEAINDCKSSDSYLADVSTGVDNAFLVSLVGTRPEKYFWLGLSNQKNISNYVWTNTDSVTFTHWNAEMPGRQQGCVAMTTGIFAGLWNVLPCTNREKYICKHLAVGAVLTPAPPTHEPPKCAQGWNEFSEKLCYKVFSSYSQRRTWYEARDYCKVIGGDLISFHSRNDLKVQPSHKTVWIGLSALDPLSGYIWSDGSPVNFQHWEPGEPNNENNVEHCAVFNTGGFHFGGAWKDVHCESKKDWICQIRRGVTPKPPPEPTTPNYNRTKDGWLEWNQTQYYINYRSMVMEDARDFCRQKHGDLVTINSEAERVFLWQQIAETYTYYWIGLNVDFDGTFEWMDGSPVVFERWEKGQPDFRNYDENCVAMRFFPGFWHDYNCGYEFNSICKRRASPPANATVAPSVPIKGGCPTNWKKFNSKCYRIIKTQNFTWDGARKQCQSMNGNLASISSRLEQVFVISEMAKASTADLWIGLHNLYGDTFRWTDGKRKSYMNFNFNRHQTSSRQFMCVVINTDPSLGIGGWIPKPCNEKNGFICLKGVDPSQPDSPEPTISTDYVKILNDSIKIVTYQMNWSAAKKQCESEGASLASLRNYWTHNYVELMASTLKAPLWIGLNKNKINGKFKYIDGWKIKFTSWDYNEPRREQSCVYIDVNGKWKTAHCTQAMNSVCMTTTDVLPTESSGFPGICPDDDDTANAEQRYYWMPFKGNCYMFNTEAKAWPDAVVDCVGNGGFLTSIEDSFEQEFIKKHINSFHDSETGFWIGLFKTYEGKWAWLDKSVIDYTYWGEGEPNEHSYSTNRYVHISTSDGTWKTDIQFYRRPYICKTPKVLPPKPSPTPTKVGLTLHHHGHTVVTVVGVIAGIAVGAVIVSFIFKKSNSCFPTPDNSANFANPIFLSIGQSQCDTRGLVQCAEDPDPTMDNLHD